MRVAVVGVLLGCATVGLTSPQQVGEVTVTTFMCTLHTHSNSYIFCVCIVTVMYIFYVYTV